MLIVGDFNADPDITPGLAKSISAGRFVDPALSYSVGAGKEPDVTCKFKLDERSGSTLLLHVPTPSLRAGLASLLGGYS